MSTIRELASSGECGQRSTLGTLAHHVTQTGQNALQQVHSVAFRPDFTGVDHELVRVNNLLHDHTRPDQIESAQALEFEKVFEGESRLVPFTPVDALVGQFQNFALPDVYRNSVMPIQMAPNIWADQFVSSQRIEAARSDWIQHFQYQQEPHQSWADEFHSKSSDSTPSGVDTTMLRRLQNCSNSKVRNSKFVQFLSRLEKGELVLDEENNSVKVIVPIGQSKTHSDLDSGWSREFQSCNDADWASEFPDFVEGHQNEWVQQFGSTAASSDLAGNFRNETSDIVSDWLDEFEDFDWKEYVAAMHRESESMPNPANQFKYIFAQNNPFLDSTDPIQEGVRLMDQGILSTAILAFEAEVQRSPGNLNAWRMLGQCNADNESDSQCIAALTTALELDPYNLESLLMLGVSHANDLDHVRAFQALKSWIENNPDYHSLEKNYQGQFQEFDELYDGLQTKSSLCSQIIDTYTKAALRRPDDVIVHTVLGVLYNISGEYDRAADYFVRATLLQPNDPRLWNKLGANQANGDESHAAVHSYKRALELKPNYVRALANLGISFANQGMYREAAQAYLAALAQNPSADHVWSYLCTTLASANCSPEVCALADKKDVSLFRLHFDF